MDVLLYLPSKKIIRHWEQALMNNLPKAENIEICRTIKSLSRRLCQTAYGALIAVLVAANADDLKNLAAIGDQLSQIPIILILPDSDKKTVSTGHKLFPRFMSHVGNDPLVACAVLSKMFKTYTDKNWRWDG